MKGYELYSWQAQGDWRFALVLGTNRLKTYDEIASPGVRVQSLEALKGALDQLPRGEQVFWSAWRVSNTVLPPHEMVDEIKAYCEQRGIQLYVEQAAVIPITPTPPLVATPWPTPTPMSLSTPTPDCWPNEASVSLSASSTTLEVGQVFSVTVILVNGEASNARLGHIRYYLEMQPPNILTVNDPRLVSHSLSIGPGESDGAEFVLQASIPGQGTLIATTSFESHTLDNFWGSWTGCQSAPLEIVVRPKPPRSS
jgi:hypothetical protein